MLTHIHHLNFVVNDLSSACLYFDKLLCQKPVLSDLPQRGVTTARYEIGQTYLVIVQPITKTGVVADILATKGEGIFLLSLATESIDEALHKLELKTLEKRTGLEDWSICDLTPIEQFGAILQLTELPQS